MIIQPKKRYLYYDLNQVVYFWLEALKTPIDPLSTSKYSFLISTLDIIVAFLSLCCNGIRDAQCPTPFWSGGAGDQGRDGASIKLPKPRCFVVGMRHL